ncbi:hypothetical protein [Streptomyces sp. NPDC096153]
MGNGRHRSTSGHIHARDTELADSTVSAVASGARTSFAGRAR